MMVAVSTLPAVLQPLPLPLPLPLLLLVQRFMCCST
jgi:hypothetical protein